VVERCVSQTALIGLTGGIGSGKSTVATIFSKLGVPVLDLDLVGQNIITANRDAWVALVKAFGHTILDGELINRKRLADICFSSREKTEQLNAILHPLIWREMDAWVKKQKAPYVIIEASVLIESGGHDRMDATIVVMAGQAVRRQRVQSRGQQTALSFDRIVNVQCGDEQRREHADFTIQNEKDVESLNNEIENIQGLLMSQFGS